MKKKVNGIIYTIIMTMIFFILVEGVIWGKVGEFITDAIIDSPNSILVISEAVLAALVLIVMLLFGNSYVFKQKKERLTKGLFYGLFFIIFAVLMIAISWPTPPINYGSLVNLIIGCFFIGVAEEFLCRGWLLNEFLERFGKTKKGIWFSIIISGLIFGVMHLGNIEGGQDVASTILQVINASATGIAFGLIYYKTKNIWSVILLHSLWDFSLMLSGIAIPTSTTVELPQTIISSVLYILAAVSQIILVIPHIKNIDGNPSKKSIIGFSILSFALYFIFSIASTGVSYFIKKPEEYKYETIEIDEYIETAYNYSYYSMENGDVLIKFYYDNGKLILLNENTNYSVTLESDEIYDFLITENETQYILAYTDYVDRLNSYIKYIYIDKNLLTNDNETLNNIKDNIKKYLLPDVALLNVIVDKSNGKVYVNAHQRDIGNFLLIDNDRVATFN